MKESAKDKNFIVYCHTNKINGKRYIGLTSKSMNKRAGLKGQHYSYNKHFWSAIQKYGWDEFEHDVLFENLTFYEASDKEKELITLYQLDNPEFGYNQTNGGEGGQEFSEISRKRMSIAKQNYIPWNKGKTMSEEYKMICRNAHRGYVTSDETKEKLKIAGIGNTNMADFLKKNPDWLPSCSKKVIIDGIIFRTIKEASVYVGIARRTLNGYLNGKDKMPKKYADRGLSYYEG